MLRRNAAKPWFPRRERPNQRFGVPGSRTDRHKQVRDSALSLESAAVIRYVDGWRFGKWEISKYETA